MKVRNEVQNVRVADGPDRTIEGVIRLRGIDARVRGRGLMLEQQTPIGVVVRDRAGMKRISIPGYESAGNAMVMLAGPVLFLATKRFFRKGRRR